MNDRKRSVGEELDYQLAVRYLSLHLSTANDCPQRTSKLLSEISKQISEHLAAVPREE
jgi:hypothetical protein